MKIFSYILSLGTSLFQAFVLTKIWGWYAPEFFVLLTFKTAIGIAFLKSLLFNDLNSMAAPLMLMFTAEGSSNDSLKLLTKYYSLWAVGFHFMSSAIMLLLGWVFANLIK